MQSFVKILCVTTKEKIPNLSCKKNVPQVEELKNGKCGKNWKYY